MEVVNLLHLGNRSELRHWLKENHNTEKCCWVVTYRSKCPPEWPAIPYIEVVEEALCFGWIDSTQRTRWSVGSTPLSSPSKSRGLMNMDRCVDLEDRAMTEAGRQAFEKAFEYEIIPQTLR